MSYDHAKSIFPVTPRPALQEKIAPPDASTEKEFALGAAKGSWPPRRSLFHDDSNELTTRDVDSAFQGAPNYNPRASQLLGYDVPAIELSSASEDMQNWVTIFGFGSGLTSIVIDYFKQFGGLDDLKTFHNANFLFLKYQNSQGATAAMSQNGSLLKLGGHNLFIGVRPRREGDDQLNDLLAASSKTTSSSNVSSFINQLSANEPVPSFICSILAISVICLAGSLTGH